MTPAPAPPAPASGGRIDFTSQIRPLLSDRCFRCHGPDASKRKAKLRLDVRDGAFKKMGAGWAIVKPFDPGKSELVRRIFTEDFEDTMPPPESNLSLTEDEKALLKRWVAEGADYRPHWSFAPDRGDVRRHPASGRFQRIPSTASSARDWNGKACRRPRARPPRC